ncbi:hypothetical protein Droror1_Dr00013703 [Drosera rotundifolia]
MFSLIYGFWRYIFSKTEFHILILGIDKAGKTTLLEKLKELYLNLEGLPPDRVVPTVGLNIGRIEVGNTKPVFWDLGGQKRFSDIRICKVPLSLYLANKQDLPGAVTAEELARYLDLKKLDEMVYMFEGASVYDGRGIKESINWLVEEMERSKRTEILRSRTPSPKNRSTVAKTKLLYILQRLATKFPPVVHR